MNISELIIAALLICPDLVQKSGIKDQHPATNEFECNFYDSNGRITIKNYFLPADGRGCMLEYDLVYDSHIGRGTEYKEDCGFTKQLVKKHKEQTRQYNESIERKASEVLQNILHKEATK